MLMLACVAYSYCTLQAPLLDRPDICLTFQVEVEMLGDGVKEEGTESGKNGSELKVLPPWMIKDGMNLTKEQRGETSKASKLDEKSEAKDDKKQDSKDDQIIQVSLAVNINWILQQTM
jgi:hypothetical protein